MGIAHTTISNKMNSIEQVKSHYYINTQCHTVSVLLGYYQTVSNALFSGGVMLNNKLGVWFFAFHVSGLCFLRNREQSHTGILVFCGQSIKYRHTLCQSRCAAVHCRIGWWRRVTSNPRWRIDRLAFRSIGSHFLCAKVYLDLFLKSYIHLVASASERRELCAKLLWSNGVIMWWMCAMSLLSIYGFVMVVVWMAWNCSRCIGERCDCYKARVLEVWLNVTTLWLSSVCWNIQIDTNSNYYSYTADEVIHICLCAKSSCLKLCFVSFLYLNWILWVDVRCIADRFRKCRAVRFCFVESNNWIKVWMRCSYRCGNDVISLRVYKVCLLE